MQQSCRQCSAPFEVTTEDQTFLDMLSPTFGGKVFPLPHPKLCPDCRQALRMSVRNERHLYRRSCDACHASMLSIYDGTVPFPVYCHECWWSDRWDALSYGRSFDFGRPFFEQFAELFNAVPRLGIVGGHNENSDYCNYVNYSKDSYLCFGCHNVDACFHCWRAHWSNSCMDCLQLDKGTACYEVIDCDDCYNLNFSQDCSSCSDSSFLYDCRGCKDCIGCSGLYKASYRIFNQQYSQEAYEEKKASLQLHTLSGLASMLRQFDAFVQRMPHRSVFAVNAEHATGDHLINCKNVSQCFHMKDAEDCRYCESCEAIKNSMDNTFSGWPAELVYETMSAGVNCYHELFCTTCWSCSNLLYCDSCHHGTELFGCIGLHSKNHHCILNVQCEEDAYVTQVQRILEHMQKTGEFGSFFPSSLSPHGYNETAAMQFYPLERSIIERRGYRWKEIKEDPLKVDRILPAAQLPDSIDDIPDDILNWAIECETTKRPFKIIKQELEFYRQMRLPVPRFHPDERHRRRMALRNPRKLWDRECAKCGKPIATSYSPERPEIVYCEECYLKEVY